MSRLAGARGVSSGRRTRLSTGRRSLALLLAAGLGVAACGSSASKSASGSAGSSSNGSSAGASSNSARAQAQAIVSKYSTRPTSIGISTPVGAPIPKGKTVAFIQCSIPSCTHLGDYVAAAGKVLGWTVDRINGGLSPETVKAAYDQAIATHADAVIGTGFDRSIFEPELATLKANHVPVIELSTADPAGNGITASYESTAANQEYGQLQADWVYAKDGTSANALVIGLPTFQTITILVGAFKQKYKDLCPSCKLAEVDISASDIGTPTATSTVVGYMQSHPGINVIETSDSDAVIGLPAALAAAGLKAQIVVLDSSPTVASYIKDGTVSVSTAAPWNTLMWLSMDTLARIFAGQSTTPDQNWQHPEWFVTSDNIPSTTSYFGVVPDSVNSAAFSKLWGE